MPIIMRCRENVFKSQNKPVSSVCQHLAVVSDYLCVSVPDTREIELTILDWPYLRLMLFSLVKEDQPGSLHSLPPLSWFPSPSTRVNSRQLIRTGLFVPLQSLFEIFVAETEPGADSAIVLHHHCTKSVYFPLTLSQPILSGADSGAQTYTSNA